MKFTISVPSAVIYLDNKRLKAVLRSAGGEIATSARALIKQATKTNKGGKTPAGSPPQSRSGALAASLKVSTSRDSLSVRVADTAYYSRFLETGAVGGGPSGRNKRGKPSSIRKMEPHPFLSTAFQQVEPTLSNRISTAVLDGINFKATKPK